MKINVLHVGKYYAPFSGGIENFLNGLVNSPNYLQKLNVLLLVHHHQVGERSDSTQKGNTLIRRVKVIGKLLYSPIAPRFLSELDALLESKGVDLIHLHVPNLSAFALLFSRRAKRVPWVIHWHSDVIGAKPDWRIKLLYPLYRILEKKLLSKASKIIVTSRNYLNDSLALAPYRAKCDVIPLGIKDDLIVHDHLNKRTDSSGLEILIVGRLTYYKGHSLLIRALVERPNIRLHIVGEGDLKTSLTNLVEELNLTSRVKFHGHMEDYQLQQLLNAVQLVCLPSIEKTEAFGLVLLEAARSSKPALVTDVPGSGMTSVVEHLKTGIVVAPNSISAISEALDFAQRNKIRLQEMGIAARKKFEYEYHIDRIANKIVKLYQTIL